MSNNSEITSKIVSNQVGLEEIFVQANHIHSPDTPLNHDELVELRQELIPWLSQAMYELGYSLTKTNI